MKTSKTISKTGISSDKKKAAKMLKGSISKKVSNETEIRNKANEIYQQRIERGEQGTAENDWLEAERYLQDSEDKL
jgi:hypothetical protein